MNVIRSAGGNKLMLLLGTEPERHYAKNEEGNVRILAVHNLIKIYSPFCFQ